MFTTKNQILKIVSYIFCININFLYLIKYKFNKLCYSYVLLFKIKIFSISFIIYKIYKKIFITCLGFIN